MIVRAFLRRVQTNTTLRLHSQRAGLPCRYTATGAGGGVQRQEPMMRVSNARTSPYPSFPYSLPPLSSAPVYGSVPAKRLRSEDSRQPFFLLTFSSQIPDACLCVAIVAPPTFQSHGFHPVRPSLKTCINFYPSISPPGSPLYVSSDIFRLQSLIHLGRVSRLVPGLLHFLCGGG